MENGVENTARIIMTPRIPYDTDISEQQWQLLKPHLPEAKTGGRKRTTNLREVINAVFYLLRAGCACRLRNCSGGHEGMRVAGSKNLELRRSEPLCLTSRGLKPY